MKFFKSVVQTMKETTWLNAKETRRDTTTVVIMSILFVAFFAVIDYLIQLAHLDLVGLIVDNLISSPNSRIILPKIWAALLVLVISHLNLDHLTR